MSPHQRFVVFTAFLIFGLISITFGQSPDEPRPLLPSQTLEREMTGAETHRYRFDLRAGEFFQVRVEQKGVDVALKLLDSAGNTLATMDSPNSKEGPETLSFVAAKDSGFFLEVTGFDPKALNGAYSIKRGDSRIATAKDKRRVEVEQLFVEGMAARDAGGQAEIALKKLQEAFAGWTELADRYLGELTAQQINQLRALRAKAVFNGAVTLVKQRTAESYRTALERIREAIIWYRDAGDKSGEAESALAAGFISTSLGEQKEALQFFNQALPLFTAIGDKSGQGVTLDNIGSVHSALGEKQEALKFFIQALGIEIAVSDKSRVAVTLSNIGSVCFELGEKQKALEFYDQALQFEEAAGDKSGQAVTLNNIGSVHSALGEKQEALKFYDQALRLEEAVGDKSGQAVTLNNIGSLSSDLGEKNLALELYNRALRLHRTVGNKGGEAVTLNGIGRVYDDLGEKQKALELYNQSLPIARQVGDKACEASVLNNLMFFWNSLRNRRFAAFYGKQSVNASQQIRSNIKGLNKSVQQTYLSTVQSSYRYLADILISDGRLPEAQAVLDLLKDEEFSGLLKRGGAESADVPYSKAEDSAVKILDRVAALGREKNELEAKNEKGELTDIERQRFRALQGEIEIAEAEFNRSLAALSTEESKGQNFDIVAKDAQAFMEDLRQLGGGAVALYTVIVNDSKPTDQDAKAKEEIKTGWIILVTPEFRKAYPIDVKDLEKTVFAFRAALSSPRYDPQPIAQDLYKKLFLQTSEKVKTTLAADLDEYFKGKSEKTLMWSLDGVLRYIPMAALHDGKTYLVEKYRNTVFNAASKARLKDIPKTKWTALGLGVSLGRTESGKTFSPLAGTKRELLTIVQQKGYESTHGILPGTIKLDNQFTSDAMYDGLLFGKNPVVHIASHFSYQPADFDGSFLLLGKGVLTVKDLSAKSTLFSNVDLLTLSACETAVGGANGKDVEGFAYLAQSIGAKAVMASLWQVDDIGTQVLMPEFYRLHETGIGKAEALRQAQLALLQGKIKDVPADLKRAEVVTTAENNPYKLVPYKTDGNPPFAHPYYWAPFVLIGNWR